MPKDNACTEGRLSPRPGVTFSIVALKAKPVWVENCYNRVDIFKSHMSAPAVILYVRRRGTRDWPCTMCSLPILHQALVSQFLQLFLADQGCSPNITTPPILFHGLACCSDPGSIYSTYICLVVPYRGLTPNRFLYPLGSILYMAVTCVTVRDGACQ